MVDKLQAEILKAQDGLQEVVLKLGSETFTFYFRYLTLLEKVRIEQMCVKSTTTLREDGSSEMKYEKQSHLIPIHTIIEKALDKDGKRLFSHSNPEHFKLISNFPAGASSSIAFQMSMDIFGTMEKPQDAE